MNRFFRVVWSDTLQHVIVIPEVGRTSRGKAPRARQQRRKNRSDRRLAAALAAALATASLATAQTAPNALPVNGQVTAGAAQISTPASGQMVIEQGTNRTAINWDSFDIGSDAWVDFRQPSTSAVALNRVNGASASQILGRMTANGQVFLTNKRGVYFGPGARVDVGGLVATTHSISDEDFMSGKTRFTRDGATGSIVNQGRLQAKGSARCGNRVW